MTTEVRFLKTNDVSKENAVLTLSSALNGCQMVAGMTWLVSGLRPKLAHSLAFEVAVSAIVQRFPEYQLWLLACHEAWQADSPMVRRRRLWDSLKARGFVPPPGRFGEISLLRNDDGRLRFFGSVQFQFSSLQDALIILEAEPASVVVAVPPNAESTIALLISDGWTPWREQPPERLVTSIVGDDGFLLWNLGAFDDRECGCATLAQPEIASSF